MSIRITSEVWEHSNLSGTPLLLILALADHANDDRICWPSIRHIAGKCRLSERHTQRLIRQLAENGHLEIKENAGPCGVNIYRLPTAETMAALADIKQGDMDEAATERLAQEADTDVGVTTVSGVTGMSRGGDRDVTGGVTGMSPKPSLNHQEPPDSDTKVSHGDANAPPAPAGDSTKRTLTPEERARNGVRRAVREHFEQRTGLQIPVSGKRKGLAAQWWNPLREVCALVEYDLDAAKRLVDDSLKRLDGLTIADPNSILKTARAIVAERKAGVQRVRSPDAQRSVGVGTRWD